MDFLIDFTQNDCKKTGDDLPFCDDPIPFSINGKVPKRNGSDSIISYFNHLNDVGSFYSSSFQILDNSQLIVLPAKTVKSNDFALSFRVRKWTNETKKLLLVPGMPKDLGDIDGNFKILVTNDNIVTVFPDPETYNYNNGPLTIQTAVGLTNAATKCPGFQFNITCKSSTKYFTFAGSDPGFAKNSDYQLLAEEADVPVQVRTTASTMFTENECTFCLLYNTMPRADSPDVYLDGHSIWTPGFYPWIHDRAEQLNSIKRIADSCFEFFGQFNDLSLENRQTTFEIRLIEGGTVHVAADSGFEGEDCLTESHLAIYEENITHVPAKPNLPFDIECIELYWIPNQSGDGPFGYIVDLWEGPLPHREFELTEETPSMAVHGYRVQQFRSIIIYVNSGAVDFLIDYAQDGCLAEEKEMCLDALSFEVDDEVLSPRQGEPVLYNRHIRETVGPKMRHGSIDLGTTSEECPYFQSSITCPSSTLYSTYAGGDPGLNKSEYLLLEAESGHSILTRNTATTIFTESDCSFCLVYDLRTAEELLESFSLWTSYFTPWTFDQSDELLYRSPSNKWITNFRNRSDEPREMRVELKKLSGGILHLWAFHEQACENNPLKPMLNVSLTTLPINSTFYFDAACFGLDWQADENAIAGAGFVLHLWEGEIIVPTNDTPITMPNLPTTNTRLFFIVGGAVSGVLILLVFALSFGLVYQCCPGCWPMRYVLKNRMRFHALNELRRHWKNDYKSHLKE
ncbi:unnamed protein product, partial [Mesorhabditis belari]|uniref:Uncharacterized protein n=1 Tax=Mesorhabditis belari TaxID=2138241 RepID=A0AAF3ERL4_9BILA